MFKNTYFEEYLRTPPSKKQWINYQFNMKNGVIENPFDYLLEQCWTKHTNKNVQSFYKIVILKNFAKFTRKHLSWRLFLSKFTVLQPATLFNRRFQHRCFPLNFAKLKKYLLTKHHTTHAKILTYSTHAFRLTHAKILRTHATHAPQAKIWPTLPTNPRTHATHATHTI